MAATETSPLDSRLWREDLFIDGRWVESDSGERLTVTDPATGEEIARVSSAGAAETEAAIDAAARALPAWAGLTAKQRAGIMRDWFDLIVEHAEELAAILVLEQGKPLAEAVGEIHYGAGFLEWYAEEGKRAYGDVVPTNQDGRRIFAIKQPVGVCAAITPWNFPSAMIMRKVAPALGAGCTIVVKPAEQTPLSATALAKLAEEAGVPAGVLNVVTGDPAAIGGAITSDARVRLLSFTGSTPVGKLLMSQCAETVKHVSLELGGNAPLIVFDDADLDAAVEGAMASKFRNAGQTCVCANRLIVQDGVYDEFVEKLVAATEALTVGSGFEEGVDQGPLIDDAAVAKVESHIADATSRGAEVATGGTLHERGGTWFAPTVLTGVGPEMRIASEETFGPVAPVFRFDSEEEALRMANATESGLAAYFFSRDVGRTWRFAERLEFGVVGVNTGVISYEGAPFGGVKQSGLGREGSRFGLDDFLEIKYVCLEGIE
ncbi:MAG: NAD-dependent succinate-semialdehyde dehydrogenase [Solirubrobacterales bacterium]|nr:NAD-dependent succinate-semialdehyde dehydrogenase [Solirubrobacterales bacterium]OJU93430.1 MAG: succinate-semialdehyde dehydrogenase (NADP(+)) [Solirubrobacterales bacterium 67-14]